MKLLPSLFKNTATSAAGPEPKLSSCSSTSSYSSWPWPSCTQTRSLSFRNIPRNDIFKTINSAYFDTNTPESLFINSSEEGCVSFSTTVASEEDNSSGGGGGGDPIETVINKGLRSERLFFEPGETSSILDKDSTHPSKALEEEEEEDVDVDDEVEDNEDIPFNQSVALSMDSPDPHADFRKSMEEMVEAHGLKDWEQLEELLSWYLRVNGKSNHGYIIGAFVDLLAGLAFSSTNSCTEYYSPSTPLSLYNSTSSSCSPSSTSTPCVSSIGPEEGSEMSTSTIPCLSSQLEAEEEIKDEDDDDKDDNDNDEASSLLS